LAWIIARKRTAIDWGFGVDETADWLLEESAKAHAQGRHYALTTARIAAAAVGWRSHDQSSRNNSNRPLFATSEAMPGQRRSHGPAV
jgi:hypothetical protein